MVRELRAWARTHEMPPNATATVGSRAAMGRLMVKDSRATSWSRTTSCSSFYSKATATVASRTATGLLVRDSRAAMGSRAATIIGRRGMTTDNKGCSRICSGSNRTGTGSGVTTGSNLGSRTLATAFVANRAAMDSTGSKGASKTHGTPPNATATVASRTTMDSGATTASSQGSKDSFRGHRVARVALGSSVTTGSLGSKAHATRSVVSKDSRPETCMDRRWVKGRMAAIGSKATATVARISVKDSRAISRVHVTRFVVSKDSKGRFLASKDSKDGSKATKTVASRAICNGVT